MVLLVPILGRASGLPAGAVLKGKMLAPKMEEWRRLQLPESYPTEPNGAPLPDTVQALAMLGLILTSGGGKIPEPEQPKKFAVAVSLMATVKTTIEASSKEELKARLSQEFLLPDGSWNLDKFEVQEAHCGIAEVVVDSPKVSETISVA